MSSEDVLAGVPLPGFAIFDALLLSSSSPEAISRDDSLAEASDGSSISPIARIRLWRKRGIYIAAVLLTLSAFLRWSASGKNIDVVSTLYTAQLRHEPASVSSAYTRVLPGWLNKSKLRQKAEQSHQIRHTDLLSNSTAHLNPKRLKAEAKRLDSLRALVQSKKSAFDPRHFLRLPTKSQTDNDPSAVAYASLTLTAVLLHSPDYDISNTQLILSLITKYPFVREIIIWNNDILLHINENSFQLSSASELGFATPVVRVFNAPTTFASASASPIHRVMPPSHVKHHVCALASQTGCLFLSPNLLPIHLDALYSLYISHAPRGRSNPHGTVPLQAVAIVTADDYYRLRHYRFDNDEIDLHTGLLFPSPGGSLQEHIASRDASRRWLKQMAVLTPAFAHGDDTADGVWSAWMNSQPEMIVAPALTIVPRRSQDPNVAAIKLQEMTALKALQLLYDILMGQGADVPPDLFSLVKASAATRDDKLGMQILSASHDDKAVFISNLVAFGMKPSELPFHFLSSRMNTVSQAEDTQHGFLYRLLGSANKLRRSDTSAGFRLLGGSTRFNPSLLDSLQTYEALWHNTPAAANSSIFWDAEVADHLDMEELFPPTLSDWRNSLSPYRAVNGRLPLAMNESLPDGHARAIIDATCWISPLPPITDSYFGLRFLSPRPVISITLFASANLVNLVSAEEEDLTAESWDVETLFQSDYEYLQTSSPAATAADSAVGWTKRSFSDFDFEELAADSPYWEIRMTLSAPSALNMARRSGELIQDDRWLYDEAQYGEFDDGDDTDPNHLRKRAVRNEAFDAVLRPQDDGEEVTRSSRTSSEQLRKPKKLSDPVIAIRFRSRDRKSSRIRVCGWNIDGWVL